MIGWNTGVYVERARAFGWNAIEIDGHNVEEIDRAYKEAAETTGRPTVIVARTIKGKGVKAVEDKDGWHGKPLDDPDAAIEELGGLRNIHVEVAKPDAWRAAPLPGRAARAAAIRARSRGGDAESVRRGARSPRVGARRRGRPRRRGEQLDVRGDLQAGASGPLLRDVHRGTAARRRGSRTARARLECIRVHLCRVLLSRIRLRPHGCDQPRGSASRRVARRRLDRRRRPFPDGARGHRLAACDSFERCAAPLRRESDRQARRGDGGHEGHRVHAHAPSQHSGDLRTGRGVRGRRQPCHSLVGRRRRDDRRHRHHRARGAQGRRTLWRKTGSPPA